jgi:hypothetical protein
MKRTVYVETTVISYLTEQPSRDVVIAGRQQATRDLWTRLPSEFDSFVSALVLQEGGHGDVDQAKMRLEAIAGFPILDIGDEARMLAERILLASVDRGTRSSACHPGSPSEPSGPRDRDSMP